MRITTLIVGGILVTILISGQAGHSAETDQDSLITKCLMWGYRSERDKITFILGWLSGIQAANRLTGDIIMPDLWPRGHRVGSVVIEVDLECRQASNKNTELEDIIQSIARRLNNK